VQTVARTPEKLRKMLAEKHSITEAQMNSHLNIVQGNAKDIVPVKQALAPNGVIASIVVSGLGGSAQFQASLTKPLILNDTQICSESSAVLLQALRELRQAGAIGAGKPAPFVCVISTTGTQKQPRDVPLAYYQLYHYALQVPHADKRAMELALAHASTEGADAAPIRAFAVVRPTLLFDGPSKGLAKVRAGWVVHPEAVNAADKAAPGPAIGHSIRRVDVGAWMFANLIKSPEDWANKCISLTY